jgi:hypothetical protein
MLMICVTDLTLSANLSTRVAWHPSHRQVGLCPRVNGAGCKAVRLLRIQRFFPMTLSHAMLSKKNAYCTLTAGHTLPAAFRGMHVD